MTLAAAAAVLGAFRSHSDLELLEVEWGVHGQCRTNSKSAHAVDLARIAVAEDRDVPTPQGHEKLSRALVEEALKAPPFKRSGEDWIKLIAGLRMDGFEASEESEVLETGYAWEGPRERNVLVLRRMLPDDVPGLDFREAENELVALLDRHSMAVPKGHLVQAKDAFARGDWAAANAQLRTFYESYLNEIAVRLGYGRDGDSADKRRFLGELTPPFLFADYNEWSPNNSKPQYVQGLMSRLHPAGSHPGLSEEDDCTFRMQISLITARLFLRRFDQRLPQ